MTEKRPKEETRKRVAKEEIKEEAAERTEEEGERLQVILARAGVASRRGSEQLISDGRVAVDGVVVRQLGTRARPGQAITVDGRPIGVTEKKVYLLYHKPAGVVTTAVDTHGRPTAVAAVAAAERVYPVGRLDKDTEGLLLLTNDGELAYRMTHPRFGLEKVYRALVRGRPLPKDIRRLRTGVELDGHMTARARVRIVESEGYNTWLEITIREGRKRQVRRMTESIGHPVLRLIRTDVGPLHLQSLKPGQSRRLRRKEVQDLYQAVGLSNKGREV